MLNLYTIKDIRKLAGKKVVLRLDLDTPVGEDGCVNSEEDKRLRVAIPTIKYLLKRKAEITIIGHRGRPNGRKDVNLTLAPVVERLKVLLGSKTKVSKEFHKSFETYNFLVSKFQVSVLENLRFDPGEELDNVRFVKRLSEFGDYYVCEAFASAHRKHASIHGLAKVLPSYAGLNFAREVSVLSKALKKPKRPLVLMFGGVKGQTKLKIVEKFIPRVDYILLGSALAVNFYHELGIKVGKSVRDVSLGNLVGKILERPKYSILEGSDKGSSEEILLDPENQTNDSLSIKKLRKRIILPFDVKVSSSDNPDKYKTKVVKVSKTEPLCLANESILDIGTQTISLYKEIIKRAGTVIWNGPMGLYEKKLFDEGTKEIAKAVAGFRGKGIVGGGDTEAAIEGEHIDFKRNIFVSTGGGAMLEFLLNPELPGIKNLIKK